MSLIIDVVSKLPDAMSWEAACRAEVLSCTWAVLSRDNLQVEDGLFTDLLTTDATLSKRAILRGWGEHTWDIGKSTARLVRVRMAWCVR